MSTKNDQLKSLAMQLVKAEKDFYSKNIGQVKFQHTVEAINSEAKLSGFSPNEVLATAQNNLKDFQKELETPAA